MQRRRIISYNNEYLTIDFRVYLSDVDVMIEQLKEIKFKLGLSEDKLVSPSECDLIIYKIKKTDYQLNMKFGTFTLSVYIDLDDDNICQQFKYTIDEEYATPMVLNHISPKWIDVIIFLLSFQQRLRYNVLWNMKQ